MESRPRHNDSEEGRGPQKRGGEEVRKVVTEGKKNMLKGGESSTSLMKFCGENLLIKYGNAVITPTQLIEFQQQAVIFRHMTAGLPLPLHLVIPIWKSVAGSFGSDVGTFYKRYPSFVGFSAAEFDYRAIMDLESGRCRRTDGKKWRCSKDVVPDQKYCERHMHRGRQHSRKLVEASEIVSHYGTISDSENLKTAPSNSQNDSNPQSPLPLSVIQPSNSKISTAISALFQPTATSSRNTENVITTSTSSKDHKKNNVLFSGIKNSKDCIRGSIDGDSTINSAAKTTLDTTISIATLSTVTTSSPTIMTITTVDEDNDVCSGKTPATTIPITVDTAAATTAIPTSDCIRVTNISAANKTNNSNNNKNNCSIGSKCSGSNCIGINSMMNINNKGGNNRNSYISAGLGFSPKSVLQVRGCGGSCLYRSDMELEPGRCRRTDGKKWRCGRVVVPDQKYCGRHMHRGAKKCVEGSQPVTTFVEKFPTIASSVCLPRAMTISNEADSATPNTNLSISIPASPRLVNNDERSPTSSSDATISDTTITAYENSNFLS